MKERTLRILILDLDEDTLIRLEQLLEDAGLSTTTTWDASEARQLFQSRYFDLFIVDHHPPELDAARLLRDLPEPGSRSGCAILLSAATRSQIENFRSMGAAVIPTRHHDGIAEQVHKCLRTRAQLANTA